MMYQLYYREVPYEGNSEQEILQRIQNNNPYKQPDDPDFRDIINKLLVFNDQNRLSWDEYFNHPFFKGCEKYINTNFTVNSDSIYNTSLGNNNNLNFNNNSNDNNNCNNNTLTCNNNNFNSNGNNNYNDNNLNFNNNNNNDNNYNCNNLNFNNNNNNNNNNNFNNNLNFNNNNNNNNFNNNNNNNFNNNNNNFNNNNNNNLNNNNNYNDNNLNFNNNNNNLNNNNNNNKNLNKHLSKSFAEKETNYAFNGFEKTKPRGNMFGYSFSSEVFDDLKFGGNIYEAKEKNFSSTNLEITEFEKNFDIESKINLIKRGRAINDKEYQIIISNSIESFDNNNNNLFPLCQSCKEKIKNNLGGEWVVFICDEQDNNYDFFISDAEENIVKFKYKNGLFHIFKIK